MGGIADIPSKVGKMARIGRVGWFVLVLSVCLLSQLAWGGPFYHMGDVRGLDVQAEFKGYTKISSGGEMTYKKGHPIAYTIRLKNRTGQVMDALKIQSSLHSNGAACGETVLHPGGLLPGGAISPQHKTTIQPGDTYEYQAIYSIPDTLCAMSGNLKVRVQYSDANPRRATSLIAPVQYKVE